MTGGYSPPSGGFSLFPNTSATKPPSRNTTPQPRTNTPSSSQQPPSNLGASPPRQGRQTPQMDMSPPRQGRRTPQMDVRFGLDETQSLGNRHHPMPNAEAGPSIYGRREEVQIQQPPQEVPQRTETAFSEANTLVRTSSNRSRSSIAKRPIPEAGPSASTRPTALRSMFPQYNPELPLDRQDYFPTQTSPTHIPRAVISRQSHTPSQVAVRSPQVRSPVRSPLSAGSQSRWPPRQVMHEQPTIPATSTTDELRSLWKVANGWKASVSEGRVYCMRLSAERDSPIYTLSSATQPLYNLRLDPTSASAYVTLSRHDPHKPWNGVSSPTNPTTSKKKDDKNWQEALATTLEEEARRHPPNDGLMALLYPSMAAKMALDRPDDVGTVMAAERECARLVWDEDTGNNFLVHPALATPFCITIERNPAWSRTEYTLEHIESPQHLARLTRDGTGEGWLEIDTAIAARIESYYMVDVAVTALLLAAHTDKKFTRVEVFEPPPPPPAAVAGAQSPRQDRRMSRMSRMTGGRKDRKMAKRGRVEEFELDLESQSSSLAKQDGKEKRKKKGGGGGDKDDLPGVLRVLVAIVTGALKCVVWVIGIGFKCVMTVLSAISQCLIGQKLLT